MTGQITNRRSLPRDLLCYTQEEVAEQVVDLLASGGALSFQVRPLAAYFLLTPFEGEGEPLPT